MNVDRPLSMPVVKRRSILVLLRELEILSDGLSRYLGSNSDQKFTDVLVVDTRHGCFVLGDKVAQRRRGASAIKGLAAIGEQDQHDATRPKDAMDLAEKPDRFS